MEDSSTLPEEFSLLRRELGEITDRRYRRGRVHPLDGVLALTVLALMCGQVSLSAIYRFGDTHPTLLSGLGLRRSPSVATLSRLLRMVSVSEMRQALLSFVVSLVELRGSRTEVVSMDEKTVRGVWEDGEQLRTLHAFSREGMVALDQVRIGDHPDEPRAALKWVKQVSRSFTGLRVLTGDALYANVDLAQAVLAEGKDYVVKLKKTNPNSMRTSRCSSQSRPSPTWM